MIEGAQETDNFLVPQDKLLATLQGSYPKEPFLDRF